MKYANIAVIKNKTTARTQIVWILPPQQQKSRE
jgi:hypothetical protein